MKANEAPEKIWMTDEWVRQFDDKDFMGEDSVEYVRKDAFIEKVVNFMKKIDDVDEYTWYNEEEHAVGITEKCIEDIKKYMEETKL